MTKQKNENQQQQQQLSEEAVRASLAPVVLPIQQKQNEKAPAGLCLLIINIPYVVAFHPPPASPNKPQSGNKGCASRRAEGRVTVEASAVPHRGNRGKKPEPKPEPAVPGGVRARAKRLVCVCVWQGVKGRHLTAATATREKREERVRVTVCLSASKRKSKVKATGRTPLFGASSIGRLLAAAAVRVPLSVPGHPGAAEASQEASQRRELLPSWGFYSRDDLRVSSSARMLVYLRWWK